MSFLSDAKPQFEATIEHLAKELGAIRTGRATPALVENLNVEMYGAVQPLKALASISTPDAKTVQIDPWDNAGAKAIESAILKSDIGINPNVNGKTIRLIMPMMTDETRQRMVKTLKEKLEDAKIQIRRIREEIKKKIEKDEDASEDDKKADKADLEDVVRSYVSRVEEIGAKKETEVTTI
ncbi:ribosome recycling factor [Candidatus Uhrbacteria bacterium CG_4_10_14_0_2_um_filter_41_7]|uniref:Ribosome-recycling factor n=1 Tax=Candidatus Uhrbacteria bacterium CG_4_9_14_3_um_filter_41_35 TaxID=1975034 RepID=A0A2M7XD56_9BACT|nr:MAG: ribosome recycling factor [Candidatus Uhrbacteria bacterium CG11_big_fil_rev_8_21_14_0_20_41_9]PIZ53590.1 MAG: ribosome recycling factor [Candidatus Uhrbacteria bacterium CG_4_10_14_0_2_um_filter_41_7]PJA45821.1 MAG: ribosome recycling factor [Candidatus Uhrbacteria bacterium CG_4_9_14_3_um_filter_41_35]